jgi:hypothetical protein
MSPLRAERPAEIVRQATTLHLDEFDRLVMEMIAEKKLTPKITW